MIVLLRKIKVFGFRRAFVFIIVSIYLKVRVFLYKSIFSDNQPFLKNTNIVQATRFTGKGSIMVNAAQLGVRLSPGLISGSGYVEARYDSAKVVIEDSAVINNGFVIIAERTSVSIGRRCLIGPNFFVTDSDFHGLEIDNRTNGNYECLPVLIKDDVFIGEGVKIMKGVTVGQGAVIGVGSVVIKDVEPFSITAGVPAKLIKYLQP